MDATHYIKFKSPKLSIRATVLIGAATSEKQESRAQQLATCCKDSTKLKSLKTNETTSAQAGREDLVNYVTF